MTHNALRRLSFLILCIGGIATAQPAPPPDQSQPPDQPPIVPPPEQPPVPQPQPQPQPVAPAPTPTPPAPSQREQEALANFEPMSVRPGAFIQALYRAREDSVAQDDTNGFKMVRARLTALAQTRAGHLDLSMYFETELQPSFILEDAYMTASRSFAREKLKGKLSIDGGQMRVPVSRQFLLSDTTLSFVEKGAVATIAPGRDLGVRTTLQLQPQHPMPEVKLIAAVYDGEGINQVENINQDYEYVGRIEITPFGHEDKLGESTFGGQFLTLAASGARNKRTESNRLDTQTYLGFDVAGSYRGLSGTFEYLQVKHDFSGDTMVQDFKANGFVAQVAYMLPVKLPPFRQSRLELGVRLEEIDRNDTVPIPQPGDPAQSVRAITACASYYLHMHNVKAQLEFSHFTELEDKTAVGENAVIANDQLLLQVTYRLE